MIYDVNSPLFRSFLSQKGGASDKRKMEEQRPKEQRPKTNENKPVMTDDEIEVVRFSGHSHPNVTDSDFPWFMELPDPPAFGIRERAAHGFLAPF
ncbi:hypothetical protein CUMW_049140 [Citrus unshiu]|nr:hypothetical protein CUMW_049140 [Citrus unshiu]